MGQSRNENILENILGAQNPLGEPQSREEALLMQILEQGGGGGSSTLAGLTDVSVTSPSNEQILKYDSETGKWVNDNIENEIELSKTAGPSSIVSFISETDMPYKSVLVNVVATGGNGTPQNPIPINGYSSANITRCGVNLWDEEWEEGGYSAVDGTKVSQATIRNANPIPVKSNTTYFYKFGAGSKVRIVYLDADKNFISTDLYNVNNSYTTPSNCFYVCFNSDTVYGTTYNNNISINYPSTDTTYHAYNGTTVTISFGQTVYGGVLDVTRGKLTVTHANIASYNGESINEPWLSSMDVYTPGGTPTTGAQVVYPLTTPFDIDLTPEVISAIVGTNNVSSDTNGDTAVQYKDSIQHYIDSRV